MVLQAIFTMRANSFQAHIVMPVCWHKEKDQVADLISIVLSQHNLKDMADLYLYDVCYAFFPASSKVYDISNNLEFQIIGSLLDRGLGKLIDVLALECHEFHNMTLYVPNI